MDDIQKAIDNLQCIKRGYRFPQYGKMAVEVAISAMQELQQYRQIGTVSECTGYKIHSKNINKLNSCNDCGRRGKCKIAPRYGEYCRINCYLWRKRTLSKLTDKIAIYIRRYKNPPFGREIEGTTELLEEVRRRLKHYEDLQERLKETYGDCDGLLETVIEELVKHDGVEIEDPIKARLLTDSTAEKWLRWKSADEQGRLLELPCAVGDALYVLTEDSPYGIEETKCQSIVLHSKTKFIVYAHCLYDDWGSAKWRFKISDFGKTVFLSREEAKKALESKAE